MSRPRILLADDHRMVAEGLKSLVEPEFEIIGIVEDGLALVESAERLQPELIIADVSMPVLNGIEAVRQIKRVNQRVKVIFLTMHPDVTYAVSAMSVGAQGYVLKSSAPAELGVAIREVLKGQTYITPLLEGASEFLGGRKRASTERSISASFLTKRQIEVMQLLAEGCTVKEAAAILGISPRTVEFHKYQMMKDIGLKTVADLVRYAVKFGISKP